MKTNKFKHKLLLKLAEILYRPEITFENESVQDRSLKEPCVIICNHASVLDGPILRYVFEDRNVCSLMAKDMMEKPYWKLIVSDCACIPVDRENATTSWLHDCLNELKNGNSVIIFPEGTTHKENPIEDFKPGFVLLAKSAGVKVLPAAVNGDYRLFTKNKLKIKVGTPIDLKLSGMSRNAVQTEADSFRNIVANMYTEITDENQNYYNKVEKECY